MVKNTFFTLKSDGIFMPELDSPDIRYLVQPYSFPLYRPPYYATASKIMWIIRALLLLLFTRKPLHYRNKFKPTLMSFDLRTAVIRPTLCIRNIVNFYSNFLFIQLGNTAWAYSRDLPSRRPWKLASSTLRSPPSKCCRMAAHADSSMPPWFVIISR